MTGERLFINDAGDNTLVPREREQEGKVWLVTGAGRKSGIGAAILREAVARGARSVGFTATERGLAEAREVESELKERGASPLVVTGDVSQPSDAQRWVNEVVVAFGRLDVVINNIGVGGPIDEIVNMTPDQIRRVFDVNLLGSLWVTQAAIVRMQKQDPRGGTIVFTGSMAYRGAVRRIPYGISKAALLGTAAGLAREYPELKVYMMNPGLTRTDMIASYSDEQVQAILRSTGQKEVDTPERLGRAFCDLVSPNSNAVSGATYRFDGERLN